MKNVYFILLILILSFTYNYHEILFKRPCSSHTWRQTDGASFALTYYQKDVSLLEPRLHNLLGNDGKTVGEFPIIYYLVGKLYKVFGYKEFLFRAVNTLLFFLGLFSLFKLSYSLLKNTFFALVITALGFSSPVVNFYANNFLPDVPALALSYIATYCFYLFYTKNKKKYFFITLLTITLAGLIKVTALIPLCVLIGVWLIDLLFIKKEQKLFNGKTIWLVFFSIVPFVVFGLWVLYSKHYQSVNGNDYFLLAIKPFWSVDTETKKFIFDRLTQNWGWFPEFYWNVTIYLSLILFVFLLVSKKVKIHIKLALAFYFMGVLSFMALYFAQFAHHDYYAVNLMPFFMVNFLMFLYVFKDAFWLNKKWFWGLTVLFVFFNVQHNDRRMHYRYENPYAMAVEPFYYINQDYLDGLGITQDKKILYYGEESYCAAFYLINRYGWSRAYSSFSTEEDMLRYKQKGASYLFVLGADRVKELNISAQFPLIDVFNNSIYIYKL